MEITKSKIDTDKITAIRDELEGLTERLDLLIKEADEEY